MKRRISIRRICAAAAAALCLSVAALPSAARADALIEEFWFTMYDVDYYVVVDAPDGGVNLRYGAGTEYSKVLDGMIPNGTVLHIDAEARANNGKYWGATEYDGWSGFIFLGHTKKTAPPAEFPGELRCPHLPLRPDTFLLFPSLRSLRSFPH